jgi:hypothetical protein
VSLQGFRTYVQTGIVLQVGATPTINAVLGVGSLEETVSVEAAAPIVDVRSAGISEVVENERIVELPLQGRQVTDLILLAGAAVQTGAPNNRSFQGGVFIPSPEAKASASRTCSTALCITARPMRVACRSPSPMHCRSSRLPRAACPPRTACTRGLGQRGDQVGTNNLTGQPVRVPPRPPIQRDQSFAAIGRTASGRTTG